MPVLASTPEQENAPLSSEDEIFLREMSQLSEEEMIAIQGNKTIIEDAYFHYAGVINPNENGEYGDGGWENMTLLYDNNGKLYGIMDHNGNVYTDIDHDGKITQNDVYLTLKKQGFDSWSALHYAGMLFGSQNPPIPTT